MARSARQIGGSEAAAFEKVTAGLRHAIEGFTEVGHYRGERAWMQMAILLEQVLDKTLKLRVMKEKNQQLQGLAEMVEAGRKH
jgi:hypothetical protein